MDSSTDSESEIVWSISPGFEVDPGGDPPGNIDVSIGDTSSVTSSVRMSVGSNGCVLKGIMRNNGGNKNKEKMADPTIQDPSRQTHYQYQHGHPVSGHPPGMMPILSGVIPLGVMPSPVYMMPPYYNCAPYGGSWYDYSCWHPDKQTVDSGNIGGSPSGNSCVGGCHDCSCGLPDIKTICVWSSNGVDDSISQHAEPSGDRSTRTGNDGSDRGSSKYATLSSLRDRAELLEKVDEDKQTLDIGSSGVKDTSSSSGSSCATSLFAGLSRLTDLFIGLCNPSTRTGNGVGSHQNSSTQATLSTPQELVEKVCMLYKLVTAKDTSGENFTLFKSYQAKEETAATPPEPAVDSMGFPLASSSEMILSGALSWESDFSSINLFAGDDANGSLSPVRSCAWCGLGGSNGKAAKKFIVCTACQSTYYCSSDCQSEDWTNGHAMMCQLVTIAD